MKRTAKLFAGNVPDKGSQQVAHGARPYLQGELAREAGLRDSCFVRELLT